MKKVLIVLALVAAFAFAADSNLVSNPVAGGTGSDDVLQYDDGTAHWLYSGVSYFGTWFDLTDFLPSATDFDCNSTEWWYYHHSAHPWDTDQIVVELWTGDVAMPVSVLASDTITALHYAPVTKTYSTPVTTGDNFWMIGNTTIFSASGIPSQLYDEFDNFTGIVHSFQSQDWILWDPVIPVSDAIDALCRAEGTITSALDNESWGAIKGLYR